MTDVASYRRYHVLMQRRGRFWFLPWPTFRTYPLWGGEVVVGRWGTFEREALESAFGDAWVTDLKRALSKDLFIVEAEDDHGRRRRLYGVEAVATVVRPAPGPPGRPLGSGLNVTVHHQHTIAGATYEAILNDVESSDDPRWTNQLSAWGETRPSRMLGLRRMNADGRKPHRDSCSHCATEERPAPN